MKYFNEDILKHGGRYGGCHYNTLFLLNTLNDGEAITSKCKNTFGKPYYHSYYKMTDGRIIDLTITIIMDEETFNALYEPTVFSIVTEENLESLDKLSKEYEDSNDKLTTLLRIALYRELIESAI